MLYVGSQTIWLFDYDLTLYGSEESYVIESLDGYITEFVSKRLGLGEEEANRVRKDYCRDYGTTLGGLRARHGVEPHDFFDFIHTGERLRMPKADPGKRALLKSLPGSRFVFTNARRDWAEMGLKAMGIEDCFEGLFDLQYFGWLGKPAPEPYAQVEAGLRAAGHEWDTPKSLVLLDDKVDNLYTARERGWSTVLVHPHAHEGNFDGHIAHLRDLPSILLAGA